MTEKISFQEIHTSSKQILGIDEKTISSFKKYLSVQFMISSSFENSEDPRWSHFTLSFPNNIIFLEAGLFIAFHSTAHYQRSVLLLKELRNCSRKLFSCPPQKLAEIQPKF